jgi:hypothetical protein
LGKKGTVQQGKYKKGKKGKKAMTKREKCYRSCKKKGKRRGEVTKDKKGEKR